MHAADDHAPDPAGGVPQPTRSLRSPAQEWQRSQQRDASSWEQGPAHAEGSPRSAPKPPIILLRLECVSASETQGLVAGPDVVMWLAAGLLAALLVLRYVWGSALAPQVRRGGRARRRCNAWQSGGAGACIAALLWKAADAPQPPRH